MRFPKEGTWSWKVLYIVAIIIKPFFLRLRIEGEEHLPAAAAAWSPAIIRAGLTM